MGEQITKALRIVGVVLALIVASCAADKQAATSGRDGSSMEQAIVLQGVTNEIDGIHAEHAETKKRFPGWAWESQSLTTPIEGRIYDVITLTKGAQTKTVYFDITDWFGKL